MKITKQQLRQIIKEEVRNHNKLNIFLNVVRKELDYWNSQDNSDYDIAVDTNAMIDLLEDLETNAQSFEQAVQIFIEHKNRQEQAAEEQEDHVATASFDRLSKKLAMMDPKFRYLLDDLFQI